MPGPADPPPSPARYRLGAEIARGAMGVVYRAADAVQDREVAVKVLQERFAPDSGTARRFAAEARITAQLQHPGVPPVHDLGTLPDGRPFLAMKLIKGETLDALLKGRPNPAADRGRFVAAFEKVCEAVGYAHAHGVVHRDLKPSNVMVGSFGEVQVMDWGLAKFVAGRERERPADEETDPDGTADLSSDPRSEFRVPDTALTAAGSILGTPAYMPPEQAIGAIDQIDARSDVFGLGGILAAVLTGRPPFVGETGESTRQMAAKGRVQDCFARLDGCGADPELVALCKRCLSPEKADRPADAGDVAKAVAALRAAADERARRAEVDRVRADERRRRVQLVTAAVVLLCVAGGAVGVWMTDQRNRQKLADADRKATEARLEGEKDAEARAREDQARQGIDANLALGTRLRKAYRFKEADAALAQAAELAAGGAPERVADVEQARGDLALVARLDDIRYRKWAWVDDGIEGKFDLRSAAPAYREAFAARGLDLTALPPAEAAARIAASPVAAAMVAAVDDWAMHERHPKDAVRLLEVARRADPSPWTDRLRDPALIYDPAALAKHAAAADPVRTRPAALVFLAAMMEHRGLDPGPLLDRARDAHPDDFELAFALGLWHQRKNRPAALAPFEAARALRPDSYPAWINLGAVRETAGDHAGAVAAYRRAAELDPRSPVPFINVSSSLLNQNNPAVAADACRRALAVAPDDPRPHYNLGIALWRMKQLPAAADAFRKAAAGKADGAKAFNNLGAVLMDANDPAGAAEAFESATVIDPKHAGAFSNLSRARLLLKDPAGAAAAARKALAIDPNLAPAHFHLGMALRQQWKHPAAAAALEKATALAPHLVDGHMVLGHTLAEMNDLPGAEAAFRKALSLAPDEPSLHCDLGLLLVRREKHAEALPLLKRGHELGQKRPQWKTPSAKWVADCEKELAEQQARTAPPPRAK
jgi:tetratricopeptide (TPR) repeat protein